MFVILHLLFVQPSNDLRRLGIPATGNSVVTVDQEGWQAMETPVHAALVRDFVNTAERSPDHDDLDSPAALARWLHEHGLTDRRRVASREDLDLAIRLREGVRRALLAHVDPDCAECRLDAVTAELPMIVRFAGAEPMLDATADDVRAGLTRIVVAMARAQGDGSWPRLKACASAECHAAYYDTSKNRSRAWCDMQVCGNRAKTRTFRERHQPI
jgi:predicted RNA-binding Zn ribbon-like protein